jgi:molecular chaperone GrpE
MPELPSAAVTGNTAGSGQEALTPEAIEAVLADFRTWLQQAAQTGSLPAPPPTETVDLHTLLAQFTAVRHEVNLQTRAVRAQQEQNAATLDQLGEALQSLQRIQSAPRTELSTTEEVLRPLLKTLVDTRDALALAEPEVRRVQSAILPALQTLAQGVDRPSSWWSRLLGGKDESILKGEAERVRQLLESLLTGYRMSLQRLDRALGQSGLDPIPCAGQPFDPEQMEVVAVVADSGQAAGTVVEEIRRGFRWRDRVFRFAQVSVARKSQEEGNK